MLFVKIILVGPPGLGKTTLRRRIAGEIADISSAGEPVQPSTGPVEMSQIIIRNLSSTTVAITAGNWSTTIDLSKEASMLLNFIYEAKRHVPPAPAKRLAEAPFKSSTHKSGTVSTKKATPEGTVKAAQVISPPKSVLKEPKSLLKKVKKVVSGAVKPKFDSQYAREINDMLTKALSSGDWRKIEYTLQDTAFITMEDTGGQPELMDMLPALVLGPSLYLLFLSLLDHLQSQYTVSYRSPSGEHTAPIKSSCTVEEVILQALSAVACFGSTSEQQPTSGNDKYKKSVAYIVGTHKDCVTEEQITEFDRELQQIIKNTSFYSDGLVEFASENRLLLAVDNKTGGAQEVHSLRTFLEHRIQRHFKKISIPVAWLILSLFLRKSDERFVSLQTCEEIGRALGMSSKETRIALWFLHHHAGVIMYFPDIPELRNTIICDIQVIYDSVGNMIIKTFKFGNVNKAAQDRFRETGQFSLEDIREALQGFEIKGFYLPIEQLVKLLEYLNILALITLFDLSPSQKASPSQPPKSLYLMPCVLKYATSVEIVEFQKTVSLNPHNPVPLMIRFECGFVPIGVFPATIANLVGHSSLKLITEGIKKNLVHFRFGNDYDIVTLMFQPRYYTISIQRELSDASTPIHEVCHEVRKIVETSLKTVTSHMNYNFSMSYQLAFGCPLHSGEDHLCVTDSNEDSPHVMLCLRNMRDPKPVKINKQLVWFRKPIVTSQREEINQKDQVSEKGGNYEAYVSSLPESAHPLLKKQLDWDNKGVDKDLSKIADHMLGWEEKLSIPLGLANFEISDVKSVYKENPRLQRRYALQLWSEKQGIHATYGSLLKVFVEAGHTQCADVICTLLKTRCHDEN